MKSLENIPSEISKNSDKVFCIFITQLIQFSPLIAITVAAIVNPLNYIGVFIVTTLFVYHKEVSRRAVERKEVEALKSKAVDQTIQDKVATLTKELSELKSQLSLSKLGNQWPK